MGGNTVQQATGHKLDTTWARHPNMKNTDSTIWPKQDSAEMGIFLFPSPILQGSVIDQMARHVQYVYLCQGKTVVRDVSFACEFLAVVDGLD